MKDNKLKKKKKRKNNKKISDIIFWSVIGIIIVGIIAFVVWSRYTGKLSFSDSDWEYMYSYIENEFGNGEEFHVYSKETRKIKKYNGEVGSPNLDYYISDVDYKGIEASIIGYFDSQDYMYAISFNKLSGDGSIKFGAVATRDKSEFFDNK